MSNAVAKGATGADQFSSSHLIPTSPTNAEQGVENGTELSCALAIPSTGAQISRRLLVNSLVSISMLSAAPVAAPAMTPMTSDTVPDRRTLEAYASWLHMERRILCGELWPHLGADAEKYVFADNPGYHWHFRGEGDWRDLPQPSSRAASVLDLVGVDWRDARFGGVSLQDNGSRPPLPDEWPQIDPILPAIAAHKKALAAYNELCVQQDQLEDAIPTDLRKSQSAYDEMVETDDPRWIEFQKQLKNLADAEDEAEIGLASIQPTTLPGVIALLDYAALVERDIGFREIYVDPDNPRGPGRSWYYFVNRNMADTLRNIALMNMHAAEASASASARRPDQDAMLERAEAVVESLRTSFVRDGFELDVYAAEQALQYFRKLEEDGSDDDELRETAIKFLGRHGQSLDWIFDGNPSGMICGLAKHSSAIASSS